MHELGETTDREVANNQRQSEKIGKGSFAYAWTFDAMDEERERCVILRLRCRLNADPVHVAEASPSMSLSTPSRRSGNVLPSSTHPVTATLCRT
jgi:hypothetical protein